jgi:hypothetical protein
MQLMTYIKLCYSMSDFLCILSVFNKTSITVKIESHVGITFFTQNNIINKVLKFGTDLWLTVYLFIRSCEFPA